MRIRHSSYSRYIAEISSKIKDEILFSPILINNETLVFPLMEKKQTSLVVSLDQKTPLVYLIKKDIFLSSFENSFLQRFRKHIGKSKVFNLALKEDDFIVDLDLESIDEFGENRKLKIELIPTKPNLLILDEEDKICDFYYKYKTSSINHSDKYEAPKNEIKDDLGEEISEELINSLFENELENRRKEKYSQFTKYLDSKIKGINKKINAIHLDVEKANANLISEDIANEIFIQYPSELKAHKESISFKGKDYQLDSSKTLLQNTEHFYKIAKRAKESIKRSDINLRNAEKELDEFKSIKESFDASNEKQCDELVALYGNTKKKKEVKETIFNRPWKLNLNGTIIYFGKNASQNDYLSFVMKLDREFTWLHIKDKSGAHLVIANKKPTENELLFAGEVSLLCSRATTGEVVYTKKKNVRRGHVLGEAILKNHSTIKLNSIRKETIEAFASAKRVD